MLASNMLNAAMYPVNLAPYVEGIDAGTWGFWLGNNLIYPLSSQIYGGHFTIAVGDPYLISSYAAKMLWYTVMSTTFLLQNGVTVQQMANNLTNPTPTPGNQAYPVFSTGSYESNYVNWLFNSPAMAATDVSNAITAANQQLTHESVWGKIFTGLADVAVDTAVAALNFIPGGSVVTTTAGAVATVASGALVPDMNSAIGSAFTTTTSQPTPMSQTAPVVTNNTYAASNLLGLLLTNFGVQQVINYNDSTQTALWSNYSINTDGLCNNIELTSNLFRATCNGVQNGPGLAPSGYYSNVYTSGTQTSTQFSIWDAILTGSDVTTDSNGYMVMGSSADGSVSFSPPVQMWNATNGSAAPTTPLPTGLSLNTTFNLNTGILTMASYSVTTNVGAGDPTTPGPTPAPLAQPQINGVLATPFPNGYLLVTSYYVSSYDSTTGVLTVTEYMANYNGTYVYLYSFANGPQTINMTSCIPNASVTLTVTPDPTSGDAYGASGVLSCSSEVATEIGASIPVTLNYC